MQNQKITPENIKSPFQLMAAWFVMLVILVSVLLTAAINISRPEWAAAYLVIFTSLLIIAVLICVTLMLTIFRPHLQDGKEYAQWLKDKNSYASISVNKKEGDTSIQPAAKTRRVRKSNVKIKTCIVQISDVPGASGLVKALRGVGFTASIYLSYDNDSNDPADHTAIWVGSSVPVEEAVESIKIAILQWPHLKYMHLSNDGEYPPNEVHYEMYFGGSTSTAKKYDLVPWSTDDILNIKDDMSQADFHRLIRSKYSHYSDQQ